MTMTIELKFQFHIAFIKNEELKKENLKTKISDLWAIIEKGSSKVS